MIKKHRALLGKEEEGRKLALALLFLNCLQFTTILRAYEECHTLNPFNVVIHLSKSIELTT